MTVYCSYNNRILNHIASNVSKQVMEYAHLKYEMFLHQKHEYSHHLLDECHQVMVNSIMGERNKKELMLYNHIMPLIDKYYYQCVGISFEKIICDCYDSKFHRKNKQSNKYLDKVCKKYSLDGITKNPNSKIIIGFDMKNSFNTMNSETKKGVASNLNKFVRHESNKGKTAIGLVIIINTKGLKTDINKILVTGKNGLIPNKYVRIVSGDVAFKIAFPWMKNPFKKIITTYNSLLCKMFRKYQKNKNFLKIINKIKEICTSNSLGYTSYKHITLYDSHNRPVDLLFNDTGHKYVISANTRCGILNTKCITKIIRKLRAKYTKNNQTKTSLALNSSNKVIQFLTGQSEDAKLYLRTKNGKTLGDILTSKPELI